MTDRMEFLGYRISAGGMERDVETALSWLTNGSRGRYVVTLNPHSVAVAASDPVFNASLCEADLALPDGTGVFLGARLLGLPLRARVTGSDFFGAVIEAASRRKGVRFFFLGSSRHVLDRIRERIRREYPGIVVCGTYAPSFCDDFAEEEEREMVEAVNAARPDVLWVGMTAPKQENWIYRNRERLSVPCIAAVGAVFDFFAGTKRRSPVIWRRLGLEWLHRLLQEPGRLWRRNFVSTPIFIGMVVRERIRRAAASARRSIIISP
jgi:N-acetylglucosaminyldiphosphoundecaprenol N-acetyl-beta-D-mannosaminyltransferase